MENINNPKNKNMETQKNVKYIFFFEIYTKNETFDLGYFRNKNNICCTREACLRGFTTIKNVQTNLSKNDGMFGDLKNMKMSLASVL